MDSPTRLSKTPKMPLFQLSPARVNRVVSGTDSTTSDSNVDRKRRAKLVPNSPSLPAFNLIAKDASTSDRDLQGLVARFDAFDVKDHAELRRKDVAALKRAQMGREEAESDLSRAREEIRRLKKDAEDSADKERKLSKRLEIVSDELAHEKAIRTSGINQYEKEMRCARKEAFRSSSALVKSQEDLKATRASLNKIRTDLDTEKGRSRQREQEAFSAQYELVGAQEALQKETERCKVVESERDALKTQLKEEEVARVAAEGMIALPKSTTQNAEDDEFASPKKVRTPSGRTRGQDIMVSQLQTEMQDLKNDLDLLQDAKDDAEKQVEFMKMECQFQCCSCRVAEQSGDAFTHDTSLAEKMFVIRPESRMVCEPKEVADVDMEEASTPIVSAPEGVIPSRPTTPAPLERKEEIEEEIKDDVFFSPQSGTFRRSSAMHQGPSTSQDTASEPPAIDNVHVTTSRPTTYVNSNGHLHEEEHQVDRRRTERRNTRRSTRYSQRFVEDEGKSLDDTIVHIPQSGSEEVRLPELSEGHHVDPVALALDDDHQPEQTISHEEEDEDEDGDEDGDYVLESPTTHIAATTFTTTVPLAPLSSPIKAAARPTTPDQDVYGAPASPTGGFDSSIHDFAVKSGTPALPNNDKENDDAYSHPKTPSNATTGKSGRVLDPLTPGDGQSAPWTPLAATGLTREEAIGRLRARRELERAKAGPDEPTRPGVTPLRTASHNHAGPASASAATGRKGAVTPGRRDISAPEARSARR